MNQREIMEIHQIADEIRRGAKELSARRDFGAATELTRLASQLTNFAGSPERAAGKPFKLEIVPSS